MRGCIVRFSVESLLKNIGLQSAKDIRLYNVIPNQPYNEIVLFLVSDFNEDMPELKEDENFPEAYIEFERIRSKIVIRKEAT